MIWLFNAFARKLYVPYGRTEFDMSLKLGKSPKDWEAKSWFDCGIVDSCLRGMHTLAGETTLSVFDLFALSIGVTLDGKNVLLRSMEETHFCRVDPIFKGVWCKGSIQEATFLSTFENVAEIYHVYNLNFHINVLHVNSPHLSKIPEYQ